MKVKETLGPAFLAAMGAFLMMNWWYSYLDIGDWEALALGIEVYIILYLLLAYAKDMEIQLVST